MYLYRQKKRIVDSLRAARGEKGGPRSHEENTSQKHPRGRGMDALDTKENQVKQALGRFIATKPGVGFKKEQRGTGRHDRRAKRGARKIGPPTEMARTLTGVSQKRGAIQRKGGSRGGFQTV